MLIIEIVPAFFAPSAAGEEPTKRYDLVALLEESGWIVLTGEKSAADRRAGGADIVNSATDCGSVQSRTRGAFVAVWDGLFAMANGSKRPAVPVLRACYAAKLAVPREAACAAPATLESTIHCALLQEDATELAMLTDPPAAAGRGRDDWPPGRPPHHQHWE